jgi:hypothetical protein
MLSRPLVSTRLSHLLLPLIEIGLAIGCARSALPEASVPSSVGEAGAAAESPPEPPPRPLAALTSEERELRGQLEKEVGAIAELGPRSLAHTWNLYSATDHLARRLEIMGYEVGRQGFPVGEEVLQNLEVVVPGKTPQTLVVAAHYDTSAESPGVNASASGAAVLLTLAQRLAGRRLERSLRMVWLCNEIGSEIGKNAGSAGSAVFAKHVQQAQVPVLATLTLGSLGYYSLSSGSQRYPEDVLYGSEKRRHFADFVAVLSNAGSNSLLEHLRPVLSAASLPVEELILPESAPLAADGPQARFWSAGLVGLMLTDTAQFRSPHHDDALDTLDKLDFDRLARVARLVEQLVIALAGPLEAR